MPFLSANQQCQSTEEKDYAKLLKWFSQKSLEMARKNLLYSGGDPDLGLE